MQLTVPERNLQALSPRGKKENPPVAKGGKPPSRIIDNSRERTKNQHSKRGLTTGEIYNSPKKIDEVESTFPYKKKTRAVEL